MYEHEYVESHDEPNRYTCVSCADICAAACTFSAKALSACRKWLPASSVLSVKTEMARGNMNTVRWLRLGCTERVELSSLTQSLCTSRCFALSTSQKSDPSKVDCREGLSCGLLPRETLCKHSDLHMCVSVASARCSNRLKGSRSGSVPNEFGGCPVQHAFKQRE